MSDGHGMSDFPIWHWMFVLIVLIGMVWLIARSLIREWKRKT
jgi:hypothetical protein